MLVYLSLISVRIFPFLSLIFSKFGNPWRIARIPPSLPSPQTRVLDLRKTCRSLVKHRGRRGDRCDASFVRRFGDLSMLTCVDRRAATSRGYRQEVECFYVFPLEFHYSFLHFLVSVELLRFRFNLMHREINFEIKVDDNYF